MSICGKKFEIFKRKIHDFYGKKSKNAVFLCGNYVQLRLSEARGRSMVKIELLPHFFKNEEKSLLRSILHPPEA